MNLAPRTFPPLPSFTLLPLPTSTTIGHPPSTLSYIDTSTQTIMEELLEAQVDNPRRSGRSKKAIDRFSPLSPDEISGSTAALMTDPVAKVTGARRPRKRQHSVESSQTVVKRRKTSTSAPNITSGKPSSVLS